MWLNLGLLTSGSLLVWLAIQAENRSYNVWRSYSKSYKKRASRWLDMLNRPNYVVFRFHVYVLWPLLAALGISAALLGVVRIIL